MNSTKSRFYTALDTVCLIYHVLQHGKRKGSSRAGFSLKLVKTRKKKKERPNIL